MKIVYYKLPDEGGENIVVTETPFLDEMEVALLIERKDESYPMFDILSVSTESDSGAVRSVLSIETAPADAVPYFSFFDGGVDACLPFASENTAKSFAKKLTKQILELEELRDQ